MQRLQSIIAKGPSSLLAGKARPQVQGLSFSALSHSPLASSKPFSAPLASMRLFSGHRLTPASTSAMAAALPFSQLRTPARPLHTDSAGRQGFLRAARLSFASSFGSVAPAAGSLRYTPFCIPHRRMSVRGKDGQADESAKAKPEEEQSQEDESKKKTEGETEEESADGKKGGGSKGKKKKPQKKKNSFADHIRGLKEDYMKFPDIYNSANGINFIIFTVFCLCSTGSNSEEKWWLDQWGLDNSFRPWNWLLHSFLTNNFLSMTYAMMLLHTLCHAMLPTLGSQGLLAYVVSTAVISGAIMWLGNFLYYGSEKPAPEKQFGPWDVVHALFVIYYLQFAITPVTVLNSFNSWLKYAVWVGEVCILYFDWQPTFVGTVVGLALCKGVPRFRVKPVA